MKHGFNTEPQDYVDTFSFFSVFPPCCRIDADINDLRLGHRERLIAALRFDTDLHGNGGSADADQARQKTNQ